MSLRLYTPDLEFYEGYIDKLADEARAGFEPALRRMADCVPRFSGKSPDGIRGAEPGIEDARLVYAVEHGFDSWAAFAAFASSAGKGEQEEPFCDFIQSVEGGDAAAVSACLARHPSLVNEVASTAKTPLHSSGNVEVARVLLEHGADPELETPLAGGTALVRALIWAHVETAESIAAHSASPDNLRVAAGLGDLQRLSRMWDESGRLTSGAGGGRQYYRPNYGWFPWRPGDDEQEVLDEGLIYASTNGRIEAAALLLDRGARIEGKVYGTTPLIRAAWRGQIEMVDWLLDRGAGIDVAGWLGGHAKGATALHIAASGGNLPLVRRLLERGANPLVRDELYQGTPQGWAEHFEQGEVSGFLAKLQPA